MGGGAGRAGGGAPVGNLTQGAIPSGSPVKPTVGIGASRSSWCVPFRCVVWNPGRVCQGGFGERAHDDCTLDGTTTVVHLACPVLRSKVIGDRPGLVRRERDDDRPLLPSVRHQEDTPVEAHSGDYLNLKCWFDVLKIEVHVVSVLPGPEACPQSREGQQLPHPGRLCCDGGRITSQPSSEAA
jgi:hypothetical protein